MSQPAKLLLTVVYLLLSASSAEAGAALPANPAAAIRVGSDLVAVTADWQLWRRDTRDGADWEPVAPLAGEKGLVVVAVECAVDQSGVCLVTLGDSRTHYVDLFQTGRGLVRRLALTGEVGAVADRDTAYLIRNDDRGKRALFRHRITDASETRLGTLQPGEAVVYLRIGGVLTPLARPSLWQFREVSDAADAPAFAFGDFESLIATHDGGLIVEQWAHSPVREGSRLLGDIRFVRGEAAGRPVLQTTGNWFFDFPTWGVLPVSGNGVADANDDVVLEIASAERTQLAVLCRAEKGPAVKSIADLPADGTTRIVGGGGGVGFLLASNGRTRSPRYQMLTLSPHAGGWRSRPCRDTTARIIDANVTVEEDRTVEVRNAEAVSADGTKVPYTMLTQRGGAPRHVIIDVYGAFGLRRGSYAYQAKTRQLLADSDTAVVFPVIRGDGDKGFTWAMASAAPHRQLAVDDVIAVAKDVVAHWPSLQARPTVRGQSAGGWLAVRAALQRPDLFAGAIGYSGAYLLKGVPVVEQNQLRFFDPVLDDLAGDVARLQGNCRGLQFRFLHARDDEKLAFGNVEGFVGQLKAQGCAAELIAFDAGGHQIAIAPDRPADFERLLKSYFTPF